MANFIFAMKRWRDNLARRRGMGKLVDFHTRNKLLILSHSQKHYRLMGKLVADGKKMPIRELYDRYQAQLMEALKLKTTIRKNINVLQHLMGYFKKQLSSDEKQNNTPSGSPSPASSFRATTIATPAHPSTMPNH